MLVRATQKALGLLRPTQLATSPIGPDDWYVNLLWIDGRKCLLLTHAGTLFPIFAADVRAAHLRPLGPWLVDVINHHLLLDQLPIDVLGVLDPDDVAIAKTASRQVLGVMNDTAFQVELAVADHGGLARCDFDRLNHDLREIPHRYERRYLTPLDLVNARRSRGPEGK
ncbi:MAG: hypothetical protein QOI25_3085 [Mycobacterium sp.]|jgi:hypothetical protein|nr:hypothetical protein [Mycobacterium sp.]